MKIQYEYCISAMESLDAIDRLLHAVARDRGFKDKLVIDLYQMAETGYSYDQIYYTYIVRR